MFISRDCALNEHLQLKFYDFRVCIGFGLDEVLLGCNEELNLKNMFER